MRSDKYNPQSFFFFSFQLEAEGQRITKEYKTAVSNLEKARSKYVQLSKEADEAEAQHQKGKADLQMKPSQLAKVKFEPFFIFFFELSIEMFCFFK